MKMIIKFILKKNNIFQYKNNSVHKKKVELGHWHSIYLKAIVINNKHSDEWSRL